MSSQPIGLVDERYRKLERLHASMRARGASDIAISRLPKLPVYAERIVFRPVLATARDVNPIKPNVEGRVRFQGRFATTEQVTARVEIRKRNPIDEAVQMARAKAIVGVVATTFGFEPYQLLAGRAHRFGPARKVAAVLLHTLLDFNNDWVGRVFGIRDAGGWYLRSSGQRLLHIQDRYRHLHDVALAAIAKRWPEYGVSKDLTP